MWPTGDTREGPRDGWTESTKPFRGNEVEVDPTSFGPFTRGREGGRRTEVADPDRQ